MRAAPRSYATAMSFSLPRSPVASVVTSLSTSRARFDTVPESDTTSASANGTSTPCAAAAAATTTATSSGTSGIR
eukprot:CAMPEP_0198356110 /NCGR_PEP_ID=MMETSP1450-20131203/121582_1 /TAXON_ID=753684 ORGANISM="Madagascaria erythrocladiodes, Strain CCMP3234" /NCGR_SAMPLE_ID=MMETSP1450 /ASSEMBLY_ACC=CAM_ASM_001115 /LENGTH=74 /DNA_ID=CAMNT_0044062563 /DNA_START=44 /DNA_END=265 /DNA_ORIENTATION=-